METITKEGIFEKMQEYKFRITKEEKSKLIDGETINLVFHDDFRNYYIILKSDLIK
jgi:hypothetical protein